MINQNNLGELLRPSNINEIIGQSHLLGPDGIVRKILENKYFTSLIFYGPVGIGKTSLATALAKNLGVNHFLFDASKDKKELLTKYLNYEPTKTKIIVIDEYHRMNKTNQDYLLSFLEHSNIYFFLCTTENPYFVINPAIRSRCNLLKLQQPNADEIFVAIKNNILPKLNIAVDISDMNIKYISKVSNGDIRFIINLFDLITNTYQGHKITKNVLNKLIPNIDLLSGAYGDQHHDLKSALQKSIRASDWDATLYYASALLLSGDFEALLRRMVIIAHEDIGLANPELCSRVIIGCDSFRKIGFPEGRIILANLLIEMCKSPKSNSAYLAMDRALGHIKSKGLKQMPLYLKDNNYNSAAHLNGNVPYYYPFTNNQYVSLQSCLPPELINTKFYIPNLDNKGEISLNDHLKIMDKNKKINNL